MVKVRKSVLPHHVKERLRHQGIQQQLTLIADQVPKPSVSKKETKDTKLRRVILYMKFIQKKKLEFQNKQRELKGSKSAVDNCNDKKFSQQALKLFSHPGRFYREAQIIFLKKHLTTEKNGVDAHKKKQETENFIKLENDIREASTPLIDIESGASSVADSSSFATVKCFESSEKSEDNDITYVPNGGVAQFLSPKEFSKNLNGEVNCESHLYENNLHNQPSYDNISIVRSIVPNPVINDMQHGRPPTPIQNASSNFGKLCQFSNLVLKPYSHFKENNEESKSCFLNSPHCHSSNKSTLCGSLPSISTFLPHKNLRNEENSDYHFNQPPFHMNRNLMNSESYFLDDYYVQDQRSVSKISPSDPTYSSDLVSSEESIVTYFSNEWVSDDTITDSGSLKDLESPINQSFECDPHLMDDENICDLNTLDSEHYGVNLKLFNDKADVGKTIKTARKSFNSSFSTNNSKKICGKNHLTCLKNTSPLPFVVQKKREITMNDDCCVPEYGCEIRPVLNEINELNYRANNSPASSCDISSRKQIKREPSSYLLPEAETSFSFKNFSQWCPTGYYNAP